MLEQGDDRPSEAFAQVAHVGMFRVKGLGKSWWLYRVLGLGLHVVLYR